MKPRRIRIVGLALAALLALLVGPAALAQRAGAPYVAPQEAVPGVTFTFYAPGFKGAVPASDEDTGAGEQIANWINLPNGEVIATEPLAEKDEYGNSTRPLMERANGDGVVSIYWISPKELQPGAYTMVVHGLDSCQEVLTLFTIE